MTALRVGALAVEQGESGAVVGTDRPRLSWTLIGGEGDRIVPIHAEVEWATAVGVETRLLDGASAILRPWPFESLRSRDAGAVRVRVGDAEGQWTQWSEPFAVVVGLLEASDWTASFISPQGLGGMDAGAPVLTKDVVLGAPVREARVWITALGIYVLRINGIRVGTDELAPGWTAYEQRLRYQSYDVRPHLRAGANRIEMTLGNGWYRGNLTWEMDRSNYGDRLAGLVQLEAALDDGTELQIGTDESWGAETCEIVADDLYNGESRAPLAAGGPVRSGVEVVDFDAARLVPRRGPAVRVTDTLPGLQKLVTPSGRTVVDFGQNLVGRVRLTVRGLPAGTEVTVKHAEVLAGGELALRPLGHAKATCSYLTSGAAEEVLVPSLTFSGFRYAQIDGVPDLDPADVSAEVLGTDLVRTGWFECSDTRLEQLHRNIVWGARGNFLDVPTDCPQRAERLGWTGDIQVFAPTANFLFDTSGFLSGWLEDLAAEQLDDGSVPWIVPNVYPGEWSPAAGWGDAATIVPLSLHDAFADDGMLARQYASMTRWVDRIAGLADDRGVWFATGQIGDWLDPDAPAEDPAAAKADPAVVATAYLFRSAQNVAEAARRLCRADDAEAYARLAARVADGFNAEFVDAEGRIRSDCQTVYAIGITFGLLSDPERLTGAGRRLAELVEAADATVSTGFLGTPHILDALHLTGRTDLAFRMLTQTSSPSWLYAVEMGATTMWERWDALLPDGRVHPGSMTSFNHYAYGAVADFLHRRVGGLRPLEPGYRRFAVEPILGDLSSATVVLDSVSGRIEVRWEQGSDGFELEVVVPPTAVAVVRVPGEDAPIECGAGVHRFRRAVAVIPAGDA
ncbi:family 78 glycoside hydrolase catalytic domain [Microbacterium sp. BWT-B31]|uniref:family 78 glycoside hydrolase catalytic domain n=1 Tax=Microbacterium sp. BWT-B31 TaxID=3232072 RepID=UPI00352840C7